MKCSYIFILYLKMYVHIYPYKENAENGWKQIVNIYLQMCNKGYFLHVRKIITVMDYLWLKLQMLLQI